MATLATRIGDLATRIATECKAIRALSGDLASLSTTSKFNLVSALNEVQATVATLSAASDGATINDAATASTTQTYSITKIRDLVSTSISAITAGAPTALDTLDELAAALGDDANFAGTITTALGNRVRFDAAQSLTTGQMMQARANIGADITSAQTGDTDTNFVTIFTTGLI